MVDACLRGVLFLFALLAASLFIPLISAAENWVLIKGGEDSYYYDKDSVVEIEKGTKEFYDASRTVKSTIKRQVRIDCVRHKYALGETVGWVGEREVSHFYWNKNGWIWFDTKGKLYPKLVKAICESK